MGKRSDITESDSQNSQANLSEDQDQNDIDISFNGANSCLNREDEQCVKYEKEEKENTDDRTVCTNEEQNDLMDDLTEYKVKIEEPTG